MSAALRALAEERELVVSFGGDDAGMAKDGEARLPQPTSDLKPGEVSRVRGVADSLAMRMRYHDDAVHARRRPQGDVAQAIYDSVEQARVESLGMRRFIGVADNVASMLEARCRSRGYERIDRFEDIPLHEAIGPSLGPQGPLWRFEGLSESPGARAPVAQTPGNPASGGRAEGWGITREKYGDRKLRKSSPMSPASEHSEATDSPAGRTRRVSQTIPLDRGQWR